MVVNAFTERIANLDFHELMRVFYDNSYYEIVFPFLLLYALFFTVLGYVKVFKNKHGDPRTSVIVIISLILSFYGVSLEISSGYSVGKLMMMMFPNISTLTILVLGMYLVGSMLGFDFFGGLFRRDHSAYLYMLVGVIGLGSVVYYVGIAMGFWDPNPLGPQSQWNMILAIGFLIMGIVFLFLDGLRAYGTILLGIFGIFVYNYGTDISILEYFVDPVIFIVMVVITLFSWMNVDEKGKRGTLEESISTGQKSVNEYLSNYPKAKDTKYKNRIFDIMSQNLESNQKALEKLNKK